MHNLTNHELASILVHMHTREKQWQGESSRGLTCEKGKTRLVGSVCALEDLNKFIAVTVQVCANSQ